MSLFLFFRDLPLCQTNTRDIPEGLPTAQLIFRIQLPIREHRDSDVAKQFPILVAIATFGNGTERPLNNLSRLICDFVSISFHTCLKILANILPSGIATERLLANTR